MSTMIQIRNVPADLHRQLKARAATEGISLSDLLLQEARRLAERPSPDEMRRRLARRESVHLRESAADAIRREREAR